MQGIGNDIISMGGNNLSQISINSTLVSPQRNHRQVTSSQKIKNSADRYKEPVFEEQLMSSIELNMNQIQS